MLLGEQRHEEIVAERQIGLLYNSLLAGETDLLRVRLSVESGDPEEADDDESVGEGVFELVYSVANIAGGDWIEARSFTIVEEKGSISFNRQLKEATIVTRGKIVLGEGADDFEIGPAVDIRCGGLEILSTGIVVRGVAGQPRDLDAVVIDAGQCESMVSRKPLVRGSLIVHWPGAQAYPWNEFAVTSIDGEINTDEMHAVYRRFRRIVTSLRSHSKGSLARVKDKVDHRRILKNQMGRALLDKLLDDGILQLKDGFYHWIPGSADAVLRVSWHDLRHRRVTPEMRAYFSQFITENPGFFEGR